MPMRRTLSLRNRLALVFFAITLLAVGAMYLYVAPGLQSRLMGQKLKDLGHSARTHSGPLRHTVGSSTSLAGVRRIVGRTANLSGDRVTLLSVNYAQGRTQLSRQADSGSAAAGDAVPLSIAERAVATRRTVTGTESTPSGRMAGAAVPVRYGKRLAAVILFSTPVSDVLRTVSTVRHQILVAGALALLV